MDLDGLSLVCAGFGSIEEDDDGNKIGYTKAPHCLGLFVYNHSLLLFILFLGFCAILQFRDFCNRMTVLVFSLILLSRKFERFDEVFET